MRSYFFLFISLLTIASSLSAQPGEQRLRHPHIQAARVAYITERMQLTPQESAAFWPLVNALEAKQEALRLQQRPPAETESVSEAEARQLIEQRYQQELAILELKRSYMQQFLEVVPARKLLAFNKADRAFKRELLHRLRDRRDRRRRNR